MHLRFLNVVGECFLSIDEQSVEVYPGMSWSGFGPCVIATGPNGSAQLEVDGEELELAPSSWARAVRRPRVHAFEPGPAQLSDLKVQVGRLWRRVDREPGFEDDVSASIPLSA